MPKRGRSNKIIMQNVWGVDDKSSQKSYRVRFRSTESADGWATAFIPKDPAVQVMDLPKHNMYNIFCDNEDIKVRIRLKTDTSHREIVVPFRGKTAEEPGFKSMYEKSRGLIKEDKLANPSLGSTRTSCIDMDALPWNDDDERVTDETSFEF